MFISDAVAERYELKIELRCVDATECLRSVDVFIAFCICLESLTSLIANSYGLLHQILCAILKELLS